MTLAVWTVDTSNRMYRPLNASLPVISKLRRLVKS
jgi:hypothetical protein